MCLSDNFSHEFLLQEVLILKFLAYLLNNKKKIKCMQKQWSIEFSYIKTVL